MERSAVAVMLSPVQHRFKVGLLGLPTTVWDPSVTLSKGLFLPAIEERLGMRLAAKEGEAVDKGIR